jgi:hypothetical protein
MPVAENARCDFSLMKAPARRLLDGFTSQESFKYSNVKNVPHLLMI